MRQEATQRSASEDVIRRVIVEHGPAAFRLARSIVRNDGLAEDVVQEALLRVWAHADRLGDIESVRAWVLSIVHNCAVSSLRKSRDFPVHDEQFAERPADRPGDDVERGVAGRMMAEELWRLLDRLDPTSRAILVLREVEAMSYEQIATAVELPLGTVKAKLFRARKELAGRLEGWQR